MHKVILDTNFVLNCVKFKIDLFPELRRILNVNYRVYVIDKTLEELSKIAGLGKIKDKEAARLAKLLIEKKVNVIKTNGKKHVDALILEASDKSDTFVATQDKKFKDKLNKKWIPVIIIRQKKYLTMS